jgi:hypothetical protein
LEHRPETTAVAVTIADSAWTSVVVDRAFATQAVETPSGRISQPRVPFQPLALVDALLKYLDGCATRWERVEPPNYSAGSLDIAELASDSAARAIERTVAEGRRAHLTAKKDAYTALGDREAARIVELIEALIASGADPNSAIDRLLHGIDR